MQASGSVSSRVYRYDNLKFFLILLVVTGHFIDPFDEQSKVFQSLFLFIYSFHMPLFLFVSGLFTRTDTFSARKIFLYLLLGYALKAAIFLIRRLFGRHPPFELFADSSVPWYLFVLAAFLGLAWLLRSINPRILLPFCILFACFAGYDILVSDFFYLSRILVFFPYFLAGYFFTPERLETFLQNKLLRIPAFILVFSFLLLCFFKRELVYPLRGLFSGRLPYAKIALPGCSFFHRLLCYSISTVMGASILILTPTCMIPIISRFGTRTLQVYLLHQPLFYVLIYLNLVPWLENTLGPTFWKPALLLIAVASAVLLSLKIFSRPFDAVLRFGRKPATPVVV